MRDLNIQFLLIKSFILILYTLIISDVVLLLEQQGWYLSSKYKVWQTLDWLLYSWYDVWLSTYVC